MSVTRVVALAFGVLVLLNVAAPVSAQNARPSLQLAAPRANDLLAKAQDALRKRLQQQLLTSRLEPPLEKPRVVCGMTVIPADPTIDAAMRHAVPKPDGVQFTLRMVEPTCRR
jgi:hypothetical protein